MITTIFSHNQYTQKKRGQKEMHQRVIAIVFEYGSLFILSTNLHFPNFKEFIENSFKIKTHTDNKYIQSLDEKEMGMQRKLWKAERV